MLKKLIGIISYLPDDQKIREFRFETLLWLLQSCYKFECDIVIIAQNWNSDEIGRLKQKVKLDINDKLGIVGARKRLREYFLDSDYDYLIMLDDDCDIRATDAGIKAYLDEIDAHPNMVGEFRGSLLKLYAISKHIYQQIDFKDYVDPELGIAFEDTVFVEDVRNRFPDNLFSFRCRYRGINEVSPCTADPYSTWYKDQDLGEMLKQTSKIIKESKC